MKIERVDRITTEIVQAIENLIPQLTAKRPPTKDELEALIFSTSSILLVARHPDEKSPIVGAASLGLFRVTTGIRAHLEDVVVDHKARSMGIGEALTLEAIQIARENGADGVELTSNPGREAANRLYQKLGFKRRETNCYIYKLRT